MDNIMGKPSALKQVNLSAVRKSIKEKGSATRSEIAEATKISVTTVRSLLTEMLENNELVDVGYDESIGGRKATRYKLNKNRFFGVALCLDSQSVRYIVVNICGEIQQSGTFAVESNMSKSVLDFLDALVVKIEIKSIGIGVPGVVSGMGYIRKSPDGHMESYPIGELIGKRYGVPVILENDLNATTLGFGRCYLKEYPEEHCEDTNMAYLHFDKDCLSAGFLSGGRILRGWNNFVGELGLFPMYDGKTLDELLASSITDEQYSLIASRVIAAICCILNPQYIAIGGACFRKDCLPLITECFVGTLPNEMSTEIVYAEDMWHDYLEGMAHLTADQIFASILLIKE